MDGELVINAWYDHGPSRTFAATRTLSAGSHELRAEYYERRAAVVRFGWQPTGGLPVAPAPTRCRRLRPKLPAGQWRGEYFNNRDLLGTPALVRNDATVDFQLGHAGSPAAGVIGADNFSARWTSTLNLPSGVYRFRATVDDGVRAFCQRPAGHRRLACRRRQRWSRATLR